MTADGSRCGLVKDVYFDDQNWTIRFVVVALDLRRFGNRQVLLTPEQFEPDFEAGSLHLFIPSSEITDLPLIGTVMPVCMQYATMSLGSPGASKRTLAGADPYLRSAKAVLKYRIVASSEFAGNLGDLVFDDQRWAIRYLTLDQIIERRRVRFHILPQSVERFTWATQRMILRDLNPVELASEPQAFPQTLAA